MLHVNSGVEFMETFEGVVEDCTIEFDGNMTHKYINILVNLEIYLKNFNIIFMCRGGLVTILMEMDQLC